MQSFCAVSKAMDKSHTTFVYSQQIIDFVTIGAQFCLFLERFSEYEKNSFPKMLLSLCARLYACSCTLPLTEPVLEGESQRFVSEEEYDYVHSGVAQILGNDDAYIDVFVEDMRYSDVPITAYISENMADVYQELKNMLMNYQTEVEEVMNDALYECMEAYKEHWGQKLLNGMRALHVIDMQK